MPAPAAKDKGDAGMLIALGGPDKPAPKAGGMMGAEPDGDEPNMDEIKSMASDDAMAAMKSGDSAAFQDAMTRFVKACTNEAY